MEIAKITSGIAFVAAGAIAAANIVVDAIGSAVCADPLREWHMISAAAFGFFGLATAVFDVMAAKKRH